MTWLYVLLGLLLLWVLLTYNHFVSIKNNVKKSYSGIDVQLKRRNDLIPNLVNTVKGYAKHEKSLLESITKTRASLMNSLEGDDVRSIAKEEKTLSNSLKSLFAVAENYPDLKANKNFLELQKELSKTENNIAASRRIYNSNVMTFNTRITTFPNKLVAKMFGFKPYQFFETKKEDVVVDFAK
ncbi:MAG: LemA family protein [Candidatus Woesearchaeota archaeon]